MILLSGACLFISPVVFFTLEGLFRSLCEDKIEAKEEGDEDKERENVKAGSEPPRSPQDREPQDRKYDGRGNCTKYG